mmetsp:Transcript_33546/g.98851  ORF Transcript_33546/g.98851 Transcript_33546/m.98851 type:complete len:87 (+) Transcript_33546:1310-1570(+)
MRHPHSTYLHNRNRRSPLAYPLLDVREISQLFQCRKSSLARYAQSQHDFFCRSSIGKSIRKMYITNYTYPPLLTPSLTKAAPAGYA